MFSRKVDNDGPLRYDSPNLATNEGSTAASLDASNPVEVAPAKAGDKITAIWTSWLSPLSSDPDGPAAADHAGPITVSSPWNHSFTRLGLTMSRPLEPGLHGQV